MTLALTTYQSKGGPLTGADIDGNWNAIAAAFNSLLAMIAPVLTFQQSTDGKSVTILVAGTPSGTFALPASPLNDRGTYAAGATYQLGDIMFSGGSSYRCPVAGFKASSLAADLAAGNLVFLARGGPGYNFQGGYDQTRTYNVADAVTLTGSTGIWVLTKAAPSGTTPGSGSTFWALSAVGVPLASTLVTDATQGTTLDQVIAAIYAQSAKSTANIRAINTQLGANGQAKFPLTLQ